jgi:hypothetical protein
MFEPASRYYLLETATLTTPGGDEVVYKRRRFLPQGRSLPLLVEVTVTQGERLDVITARTLGDPQQFWRVCDANDALNPLDLTAEPGRVVRIPIPQP